MIARALALRRLQRSLRLSPPALRALQEQRLRALVLHAYETVPYYRSLFRSAGILPQDIRTPEDLRHVPVTTTDDLRAAGPAATLSRGADPRSLVTIRTSGTTGEPFAIHLTARERKLRGLVELRGLLAIGFRPWDRLVVLGPNAPIGRGLHQRLGLFRIDRISALLPVDEQVRRLRSLRPTILWAYPTTLRALLTSAECDLSALCRPRLLITSAEMFQPLPKGADAQDGGLDPAPEHFNFYGCVEAGRIAWECPSHAGLHVNTDRLVLEIDRQPNGALVDADPMIGEAIVTVLDAWAMPFIRFRLGDLCRFLKAPCACGRSLPLIAAPVGRALELIRLPSGRARSPTGLSFVLREFQKIGQFRLTQEEIGRFVLEVTLREAMPEHELASLEAGMRAFLDEPVALDVRVAASLQQPKGKHRAFVSRLS